jgi:glutaredoxin-related protein
LRRRRFTAPVFGPTVPTSVEGTSFRVACSILKTNPAGVHALSRPILDETHIHPAIRERIAGHHADIVSEVQSAIATHNVVVVGMSQNPMPKKARKLLDQAGIAHHYLEYGSYFNSWRRRNALKMWTGWPTFPMVFVKGTLVGGAQDVERLLESGELKKML